MNVTSIPAFCLNSSMVSEGEVPTPDEPQEILPGWARAAAISYCGVSCGNAGLQHSRLGWVPIHAAVSRSVKGL